MVLDKRHLTEKVYDEKLAPLIEQLLRISAEYDIPMIVSVGMVLDGMQGHCTNGVQSTREELKGMANRYALSNGIIQGKPEWDRACALKITRFK